MSTFPPLPASAGPPLLPHFSAEAAPGPPPDLRSACSDFEAIFLSLLFQQMRSTVPGGGILRRSFGRETFDALWIQEIARLGARSTPLGIADALFAALSPSAPATPRAR